MRFSLVVDYNIGELSVGVRWLVDCMDWLIDYLGEHYNHIVFIKPIKNRFENVVLEF